MPVLDVWSSSMHVQDPANLRMGKQHCYQMRKKIQNPENRSRCGAAQKHDAPVRNRTPVIQTTVGH